MADDCVCEGKHYLLGQTYDAADIADGFESVQRCDECDVFESDETAARAAASLEPTATGEVRYFRARRGNEDLGDWAIGMRDGAMADGSRSTAATANGRDLDRHERRTRR